jgi:hypothetical protein
MSSSDTCRRIVAQAMRDLAQSNRPCNHIELKAVIESAVTSGYAEGMNAVSTAIMATLPAPEIAPEIVA